MARTMRVDIVRDSRRSRVHGVDDARMKVENQFRERIAKRRCKFFCTKIFESL